MITQPAANLFDTLAYYSSIPTGQLAYLLALKRKRIFADKLYRCLVDWVDTDALRATHAELRGLYDTYLPQIRARHNLRPTMMNGSTLVNWILGFASQPEHLPEIFNLHMRIPAATIATALPDMLMLMEQLATGAQAWQYALTVFSLPLLLEA